MRRNRWPMRSFVYTPAVGVSSFLPGMRHVASSVISERTPSMSLAEKRSKKRCAVALLRSCAWRQVHSTVRAPDDYDRASDEIVHRSSLSVGQHHDELPPDPDLHQDCDDSIPGGRRLRSQLIFCFEAFLFLKLLDMSTL